MVNRANGRFCGSHTSSPSFDAVKRTWAGSIEIPLMLVWRSRHGVVNFLRRWGSESTEIRIETFCGNLWVIYLSKCSTSHAKFYYCNGRNHHHRRTGNAPAQCVCPFWIDVISVPQWFVANQTVHNNEQKKYRRNEFPTYAPIDARIETNHITNVITKTIGSIDPRNRNRFKQNSNENWIAGRITIQ